MTLDEELTDVRNRMFAIDQRRAPNGGLNAKDKVQYDRLNNRLRVLQDKKLREQD